MAVDELFDEKEIKRFEQALNLDPDIIKKLRDEDFVSIAGFEDEAKDFKENARKHGVKNKNFEEDVFSVDLAINDQTTGTRYVHPTVSRFTTIGPVVIDHIEFLQDTTANPGDQLYAYVHLRNDSPSKTAESITAKLTCPDTLARVDTEIYVGFGDIPAGETVRSKALYKINITDGPFSENIYDLRFALDIHSDGYVFWTDSTSIMVGLEHPDTETPTNFKLHQNYPNPFNPVTTIDYELPITNYVRLDIYTIRGQRVETLVNGKQIAGMHTVEWDASSFSSGVYFYKLSTDQGFSQTRKLILIK